jgi:lipopolysaccharide/colanic/teichoic acid biosynthesis glycosyltransferase
MLGLRLKRIFDVVVSLVLLIALSPVFCLIVLLIWITMGFGFSIIFRQPRLGYLGRPFLIYKFRTMNDKRDAQGNSLPDEARLTPLGRFLRLTSLDELPELVNVLRGEMSFVGPRPLLVRYFDRYTPEQRQRHKVRPGITGWAQVNGRNAIIWEEKFKLDVWYVDNQSLWLDLKIIAITIWKIIKREGISQPGHATMEEFFGSDAT